MAKRVVIIGAGPTGIGAAHSLMQHGHRNWIVYEKETVVGGLSRSVLDTNGFSWDCGGHVFFTRHPKIKRLLDSLPAGFFRHHQRKAFIRLAGVLIPYPFQLNCGIRPKNEKSAARSSDEICPTNFAEWLQHRFGPTQCERFFFPYNAKVWRWPLTDMSSTWTAERISPPGDANPPKNWGPNATFRYPARGGIGTLFKRLAQPADGFIQLNRTVKRIDTQSRKVLLSDGTVDTYDALISTVPLSQLIAAIITPPPNRLMESAQALKWNACRVTGVGFDVPTRTGISWIYFPEPEFPFYRATALSTYADDLVPHEDSARFTSFLLETSLDAREPTPLADNLLQSLPATGLYRQDAFPEPKSFTTLSLPYAYPIPTIGRDKALAQIQEYLETHAIFSRGRFGGWKYEVGNMDHSLLQGMEAAERILLGREESVYQWR